MFKRLLFTVLLCTASGHGHAALIDTFILDMGPGNGGGSGGVFSSVSLDLGVEYRVSVIGTFEIGCIGSAPCPTDAEYYVPGGAGSAYTRTGFDNPAGLDIGARINGVKIAWGTFNPARIYSTIFVGLGGAIEVDYQDSNYGDNRGELTITIETLEASGIPAPATIPLALLGVALTGTMAARRSRQG